MQGNSVCPSCGSPLVAGLCPACPAAIEPRQRNGGGLRGVFIGLGIYFLITLAIVGYAGYRLSLARSRSPIDLHLRPRQHTGPVARLDQLQGVGTIYFVQIGPHTQPYSLESAAEWLHGKYGVPVRTLAPMGDLPEAWNDRRRQYQGQALLNALHRALPDITADPDAYLIGVTDADMYTSETTWLSTFTLRDRERTAVISMNGMEDTGVLRRLEKPADADAHQMQILRRILLKDVGLLYWHLALNDRRGSILSSSFDPANAYDEIYETDVAPQRTAEGLDVDEPCIYFEYSARDGMRPYPGPLLRGCGEVADPVADPGRETFEFVVRLGLLEDKHTDVYQTGVIPIALERVTRDGWKGMNPLGISGTINYNEYLASANNIHIDAVRADGVKTGLDREQRGGADLAHAVYVDTANPGLQQLRWFPTPYEHYELRNFDGGVKSYLPCLTPDTWCYLTDFRDFQGRQLRFARGAGRRLLRLTAPEGASVSLDYDSAGRIAVITTGGGKVRYGYDAANRLVRVTYPSGVVFLYEYDSTQHLLTFSTAQDAKATPHVWMRNGYTNGLLTRQTLDDGRSYVYAYNSSDLQHITAVAVDAPGRTHYDVQLRGAAATVHEHADTSTSPQ